MIKTSSLVEALSNNGPYGSLSHQAMATVIQIAVVERLDLLIAELQVKNGLAKDLRTELRQRSAYQGQVPK